MTLCRIVPISLVLLAGVAAAEQSSGPGDPPTVYLENNRVRNKKDSNLRIVDGLVKDSADNPLADAIVQLKNTKTSSIVNFSTKQDGRYVFRDLPMDINYELVAKRGDITAPVKKVSVYDTRKHLIVNFQLAAAKP